jgi:peptidoglycan/LPS O-acetylase OafA/YrhL
VIRNAASVPGPPDAPAYIGGLTPLRGLAATWVVAFHFDDMFGRLVPRESSLLIAHGNLMVDFFFVLSGFVICHVYGERLSRRDGSRDLRGYLRVRFFRLIPLHVFALALHGLLYALVLASPTLSALPEPLRYYDPSRLLPQLFLLQALRLGGVHGWNMPSWSISAEWWTYLLALAIIPALHDSSRRGYRFRWPVAALALFAGIAAYALVLANGELRVRPDHLLLRCVLEFSFGVCIYQWYRHGSSRALGHDLVFWAVLAGMLLFMHAVSHRDYLLVPIFGLLIVATARNRGRVQGLLETRSLRWFGDISYAIYMLHYGLLIGFWLLQLSIRGSAKRIVYEPVVLWCLFGMCMALLLLASGLVHRYLERPIQRWAHRRREPAGAINRRPPENDDA